MCFSLAYTVRESLGCWRDICRSFLLTSFRFFMIILIISFSQWGLVCSLRPLKQMIQTIYMGGVLTGAIIYGGLSDRWQLMFLLSIFIITVYPMSNQPESAILFRFGRRSVLIWSYLQLAILGCSAALSPTYSVYCIFRFLCGMAVSGIIINGVSLSKGQLLCYSWSADSFLFYSQWFSFCLLFFLRCLQRWSGSQPKRGL